MGDFLLCQLTLTKEFNCKMIRVEMKAMKNLKITKMNKKLKGVLLLCLLFAYAGVLVSFFYAEEEQEVFPEKRVQSNLLSNNLEYREVNELELVEFAQEDVSIILNEEEEEEGEVKGWKRKFAMGRCDAVSGIEEPQLFCDAGGGISSSTEFTLAEVFAPDILFIGAAAPYDNILVVNNNAGRISFRNASELINPEHEYLPLMPLFSDDHPKNPRAVLLEESKQKDPFKFHLKAAGSMGETDFDTYPGERSLCQGDINDGRFNVKGSNQIQENYTGTFANPFLVQKGLGNRDVSARLCDDPSYEIHLNEDESFLLCSESFWDAVGCDAIETFTGPSCEDIQGIVIDAPHGSGEICNEEDCAIRSKEGARMITSPPSVDLAPSSLTSEEKKLDYIVDDPVILTTPCKVRVGCKVCLTKCIWDISIWQHVYELEKNYTYPGFKNTIPFQEYWKGVEDEIKIRGRIETKRY